MSSTFNLNFDGIVNRALRKLGNTYPSTVDITNGKESLNVVIKNLDPVGRWFWTISNAETTINLVAGQSIYPVATPPTGIQTDMLALNAFFLYIGNQHVPVRIIQKTEATTTWDRDFTGQPYEAYLEKATLPARNQLWVYPTPNGPYTGLYTYKRLLSDLTNPTDVADFPQSWVQCLTYQLAADLSDEYGPPPEVAARIQQKADFYLKKAMSANAETGTPTALVTTYF